MKAIRKIEAEKKEIFIQLIKYIFIFFCFYIISKANINGVIHPFSFGLLFALMWCNNNVLILAPLYISAIFLGTFSLQKALFTQFFPLFLGFCLCLQRLKFLRQLQQKGLRIN